MLSATPRGLLNALNLITTTSESRFKKLDNLRASQMRHLRSLAQQPNVVGIGISEKTSNDETTGELSVCFYVGKKIPPSKVRGDSMVPPLIRASGEKAFYTDVKEVGKFRLHAGGDGRLKSGASVSHARDSAGTIGAIVKKAGRFFILSNAHVLALSGRAKTGDPVLSPGVSDGGTLQADVVARLAEFVAFNRSGDNLVDAAIAEILPNKLASVQAAIPHARLPINIVLPQRGMQVVKFGKSTGQTTAHVIDVNFRLTLPYPHNVGLLRFSNQVLCTEFADNGDSGSLVVDDRTGRIVGLHFAGANNVSVFNSIGAVVQALGFTFAQ